jgi:hypothetical protein
MVIVEKGEGRKDDKKWKPRERVRTDEMFCVSLTFNSFLGCHDMALPLCAQSVEPWIPAPYTLVRSNYVTKSRLLKGRHFLSPTARLLFMPGRIYEAVTFYSQSRMEGPGTW